MIKREEINKRGRNDGYYSRISETRGESIKYTTDGANPAVNTPRPSRGKRIESCDFIVLIGDP